MSRQMITDEEPVGVYRMLTTVEISDPAILPNTRLGPGVLTTARAEASYGQPVLVYAGRAWSRPELKAAGMEIGCGESHQDTPSALCRVWDA